MDATVEAHCGSGSGRRSLDVGGAGTNDGRLTTDDNRPRFHSSYCQIAMFGHEAKLHAWLPRPERGAIVTDEEDLLMGERVTVSMEGGVADVRLNRPEKLNALDHAMFEALIDTGKALTTDRALRAVVLSGEGRAFCAGLDFASFMAMTDAADTETPLLGRRAEGPA